MRSHQHQSLVRVQDLEFRTAIAAIQTSRRYTGTISMGGNGQFTTLHISAWRRYGFCYAAYIYTFYITSWRAFIRLVRGHNGWAKTRRNTEVTTNGVTALES